MNGGSSLPDSQGLSVYRESGHGLGFLLQLLIHGFSVLLSDLSSASKLLPGCHRPWLWCVLRPGQAVSCLLPGSLASRGYNSVALKVPHPFFFPLPLFSSLPF